ncbi:MAG: DMT family transporter [Opitutae bacterium]|nr:DMT family transporter [Opitutae bacterium]
MLPAFLTALFFSLSVVCANRSIRAVGGTRANVGRLLFALVALGLYAHIWGNGMGGAGRDWLLLSGVIGMGLGDIALFGALPLLGSRLTVLITQCLAAPLGAVGEWWWLGTALTGPQILWGAVILAGVALALAPSKSHPPRVAIRPLGFLFALGAAAGQGFGALVSRKANTVAHLAGESIDGITAAYQRIAGGLAIALAYFAIKALLEKSRGVPPTPRPPWRAYLWIPANAGFGAVIGVSCYQWALFTAPSGIVLPIVACTPLVIIPFSYWLEGERPTRRSLLGGAIAVIGAVSLTLVR